MKNILLFVFVLFSSCFPSYPLTTIWVSNQTNKTVHFKASTIKYTSTGPFEMTLPFSVQPYDSVLVRRIQLKPTANPTDVMTNISFFPIDSIKFLDAKIPNSWIKTNDSLGRPQYTFYIKK